MLTRLSTRLVHCAGSIERAALHVVLRGGRGATGGQTPSSGSGGPPWVPRPALLAAATGLPPGCACPEATTFLEQATIVVRPSVRKLNAV